METTFISAGNLFEGMLGDINYEDEHSMKLYPFKVRCGMPYRRPPRHEMWEYYLEMGRPDIDHVFLKEPIMNSCLTFVFPERWMNVSEQRSFMYELTKHPDVDKIKQVDIITHSPLILGSFTRHMIRVLKWDDDLLYDHEKQISFHM
jgi:hypothetical protein